MPLLQCGVAGCGRAIRGMTGLQEIQNLRKHVSRKHKVGLDTSAALEWRTRFEEGQQFDMELGIWFIPEKP